ncbi:MAG: dUTP diphosphatase [Gemmatimonadota bacterium]
MADVQVRFQRLGHNPDLPLPSRATEGAAGYDVRAAEAVVLEPGGTQAVSTGLVVELPSGIEAQVRPRSGLALREGVVVPNSPGTIDPDFRGELKVILMNLSSHPVAIARGDRVAQLVFARFERPTVVETDAVEETDRGVGGFGSTGRS